MMISFNTLFWFWGFVELFDFATLKGKKVYVEQI
jgi:hypothetical protein